jgi:hypothetical protein
LPRAAPITPPPKHTSPSYSTADWLDIIAPEMQLLGKREGMSGPGADIPACRHWSLRCSAREASLNR